MLKRLFFGTALASMLFHVSPAKAIPIPQLRQGMPYREAREILIQNGWQAFHNNQMVNSAPFGSVQRFLINQGFVELIDCSGTGLGLCLMQFQDYEGNILSVSTANNEPNVTQRQSVILYGWGLD